MGTQLNKNKEGPMKRSHSDYIEYSHSVTKEGKEIQIKVIWGKTTIFILLLFFVAMGFIKFEDVVFLLGRAFH